MGEKMTRIGIAAILLLPGWLSAQSGLGMWSWSEEGFATEGARMEMLDYCGREGISHIDQHVGIRAGKLQNGEALTALVAEAAKRNITVNALRGDKEMFFAKNHTRTMEDLEILVAFNQSLPQHARFAGIKFDVEPYLTPEWKAGGEQRMQVILDYLTFLQHAKQRLDQSAPEVELSVDIPFWWDKPIYDIEFNGASKRLVHHIQDAVDWIGIMSYRRDPQEVLKLVEAERAYAVETKRPRSVAPTLETGKISGSEAKTSFGGVPPDVFRQALEELRRSVADDPAVRLIMLHHYGSLRTYLAEDNG